MTNKKKYTIIYQILTVFVGICISIYYCWCLSNVSIPFHSDDAGSTFEILNRNWFTGGGSSNPFDLFGMLTNISVFFWGINEFSTLLPFYLAFFIRFYLTSYILIDAKHDKYKIFFLKILFLVWCSCLLGVNGNAEITASKFHIGPSIIILMILLVHQKINHIWIRRILTALLLILSMLQTDRVLSGIICVIPVILFYLIKPCIGIIRDSNLNRRKQFILGFSIIMICLVCGLINIYAQLIGHTFSSSDIYGSRTFSSLQEILNNTSTFFQGIFGMFNCQVVGEPIISVLFIPRFIKCILLCGTMIYIIVYLVKCIKQEIFSEYLLLLCIVAIITFLAFIMTGSQHGQISIRYCNIMLFIFPIMAWNLLSKFNVWMQFRYSYKVLLLIVLCITQLNVVNHTDVYSYDHIAHKLESNNIDTAIAPYWCSTVVTVISEGKVGLQPCTLYGGKLKTFMNKFAPYSDKSTRINAVITSSFQNDFYDDSGTNLTEESIPEFYGQSNLILELDEFHKVHIYDYDLRTLPQKFIKVDENKYCLEGPFFGEYRIDITCGFSGNLAFEDGVEILGYSETKEGSTYLIRIVDKMDQLVVESRENKLNQLDECMVLKRIWEACSVKLSDGSLCSEETPYVFECGTLETEPKELKAGRYKLVLYGENLSKVSINSDITINQGDHGTKRLVYYLDLYEDIEVSFTIQSPEKVSISNISLEVCQ